MEFAKLYNFDKDGAISQLLVILERGKSIDGAYTPHVLTLQTVIHDKQWIIDLPHYFNKDVAEGYFQRFDEDDAMFWMKFIKRQISTPVYLDRIKFLITEINDVAYLPAFFDAVQQEYDINEYMESDILGAEVTWRPDGCYWQVREFGADDDALARKTEQFDLRRDGEIVDSFIVDHNRRRSSDFTAATLMLEVQKMAYAMEREEEESLGSM